MKKTTILAIGTTLISGLGLTTAQAETPNNPFSVTELSAGYMQLAEAKTDDKKATDKVKMASCGEGKCGGKMMKGSEEKNAEGNCAGNKPMPKTATEAKCGEGKCGGAMKMDKK
ncbi:MAG: hypothetical protein KAG10_04080 [Methylococcales bacterium]|nr:hypothetical protein [Methylococcales bacterium]MCK5925050.1 hypothetical protein [Methylococcales bacterium]